jgi:hypothetical protein
VLLQEAVDEGERRWRGEVEEVDAEWKRLAHVTWKMRCTCSLQFLYGWEDVQCPGCRCKCAYTNLEATVAFG